MKVLVTGAGGYIGNPIAHRLAEEQHQVIALVRSPASNVHLNHPNIQIMTGDITLPSSVQAAMKGCQQVYHVAGYARLWSPNPSVFYNVNVDGTRNLLLAALKENVEKFVYTSSTAVFGPSLMQPTIENDPRSFAFDNDYDLSKHLAEQEVFKYIKQGLSAVIVNPSRVYGPGLDSPSNAISRMLKNALQGRFIFLPGKASTIGNYAYIDDVVNGHINAMHLGKSGERYILGGENKSYQEIKDSITNIIGPSPVVQVPMAFFKLFLLGMISYKKITGQDAICSASGIMRYTKNSAFDCSKAKAEINYRITPFDVGIEKTIQEIIKELPCHPEFSHL
jgi:nucleoside-diphosphate-sugar epimerase